MVSRDRMNSNVAVIVTVVLFIVVLFLFYSTTVGQERKGDPLSDQVEKLRNSVRSKIMKDAVTKAHQQLSSREIPEFKDAVLFLADLKAKAVLFSILNTRIMARKLAIWDVDIDFLAGMIESGEDISFVCKGMLANSEGKFLETGSGETLGLERIFLDRLGKVLAGAVGVEFTAIKEYDEGGLRKWMVTILRKGLESEKSQDKKAKIQFALNSIEEKPKSEEKK
jgi:hypothetical protein